MNCSRMLFAGALCAALGAPAPAARAAETVTLALNWVPGADHAPYYYAKKMGWYAAENLDVSIEAGRGSAASAQKVGAGTSQLGVADLPVVLSARGKGADLVAVMDIYANSAQGFYWLKSSGIAGVKDLAGKRIGNPPGDAARVLWPALAKANDVDPNSVTWVNIDANAKLAALKAHTVDATTSFYDLHYIFAPALGKDMGFLAWRDAGLNPYGNVVRQRRVAESAPRSGSGVRQGHAEGVLRLRQGRRAVHPGARRRQQRPHVRQRDGALEDGRSADERRDLADGGAGLARRRADGERLQAGRGIYRHREALRREGGVYRRVSRQEPEDDEGDPADLRLAGCHARTRGSASRRPGNRYEKQRGVPWR
jgi:hypothetical protein